LGIEKIEPIFSKVTGYSGCISLAPGMPVRHRIIKPVKPGNKSNDKDENKDEDF
jgi:hypothetical protein